MAWLNFLFHVSGVLQLSANIIVMFYAFPAFKRTNQRAFLFIWIACLLGTFDTIFDHTIGLDYMGHSQYVVYRTLRRFTYFTVIVFDALGIVMLIQSYLQLFTGRLPTTPLAPDSFPNDLPNPTDPV